ncbi:MAG: phage tail length tape measure family protein [Asticcacaulis sp.]|nr:phage tail length tape measure family protein [Asticcacaulis sp.]
MTDKRISIRLGMDGKSEFKRDVSELETQAKASFGNVKGSIDGATASTDDLVAALKRASAEESATLANASRTSTAKGRAAARDLIGIDPSSAAKAGVSAAAITAELKLMDKQARAVRYSLDPLAMATDRYAAAEAALDKLLKNGKITIEQHGAALKNEKVALDQFTEAHNKGAKAVGLSSGALRLMAVSTLPDLAQGLLAGQFSFASFVNQAGQAVQIAGMQPGGFGAAMRSLTSPAVLAAGAIGLVGGALFLTAKAGYDFGKSISEAELAVMGIGAASRLTGTQVVSIAAQAAKAGDISVSSAESGAAAMLRAGMVNKAVLGDAIALTRDYGLVTGRELPAAQDALAKALADPVNGVKQLNAELLLGDANWQKNVISMAQAGDKAGAVAEIISAMKGKIGDASKEVYGMAGAMDALGNKMSNFWHGFGQLVNPDPATILNRMADFNKVNPGKVDPNYFGGSDSTFQKAYMLFWKDQNAQAAKSAAAAKDQASLAAQSNLDFLNPTDAQRRDLDARGKQLEDDLKAGNITLAQAIDGRAKLKQKYAALDKQDNPTAPGANRAASLAREAESVKVNTAATLDLAEAYLTSNDAALKAEATRKAMTEATRKGTDVAAAVQRQMDLTNARAVLNGAKSAAASRDQAAAQKVVNDQVAAGLIPARDAQQSLQEEAILRPLIALRTKMQGDALDGLNKVIEAATKGLHDLNTEQQRANMLTATEANADQLFFLQRQLELIDATNDARAIALAQQRTGQEIARNSSVDPDNPQADNPDSPFLAAVNQGISSDTAAVAGITLDKAKYAEDRAKALKNETDIDRLELSLLGQKDAAIQKALALEQARQDLKERNISLESEEGQKILGAVAAREDENAQLERGKAIQGEIRSMQDQIGDRLQQYLMDGKISWKSLGDTAENVLNDIMAEVVKLAVINPFKNWAFGQDNPTLNSGGIASILSSIFNIGGHADGTESAVPGYAWVGERGPELMKMRAGDVIKSNPASNAMTRSVLAQQPRQQPVVVQQVFQLNAQGAVVTEELINSLNKQARTYASQAAKQAYKEAVKTSASSLKGNIAAINQRKVP